MRILVIGAGAVGGYFGGRLVQADRDVTFLVRGRRAEELRQKGLQIVSPHGNLTVPAKASTSEQITGPYDLILLAVKSYSLGSAMDDFAPAVGPGTTILPVLNGIRHIDLLVDRFGKRSVLGGVCLVATELDHHGRINQLADFQRLTYGEINGQITQRIEAVDKTLQRAGFEASVSERIVEEMWQKWVQLATVGAINCLMRGNIGQIIEVPGGSEICLSIFAECAGIAQACGFPQSPAFVERQKVALTARGSMMTSSMYRDLKKGLPVEADAIVGDLLRRGQRHGLKTQLLEAAFVNLSVYQHEREDVTAASHEGAAKGSNAGFKRRSNEDAAVDPNLPFGDNFCSSKRSSQGGREPLR